MADEGAAGIKRSAFSKQLIAGGWPLMVDF
jgi:hypothetical protein